MVARLAGLKQMCCVNSVKCLVWEPQNLGFWHFGWRPGRLWKLALKGVFRLISGVRGQGVTNHCFRTESTLHFWVNFSITVFYDANLVGYRELRYKCVLSTKNTIQKLAWAPQKALWTDLSRYFRQNRPGGRKLPRNLRLTRQRVRYIFDTLFSRPFFTIQILRIPRVTLPICSKLEKHETKAAFA